MSRTPSSRQGNAGVEKDTIFSWTNDNKYKVVLVGDSGVGKTSIFWQYIEEYFPEDVSELKVTMVDFKIKNIIVENELVKMYIWDTAGQERYRALVSNYFKGTHGIMLVFDLSSPASFQSVKNSWISLCRDKSPQASLVLIGNKADLENKRVSQEDIDALAKGFDMSYFEVSAFDATNITEAFNEMAHNIKQKFFPKAKAPIVEEGGTLVEGEGQVGDTEKARRGGGSGTAREKEGVSGDRFNGNPPIRESIQLTKAAAIKPSQAKRQKADGCSC